jgi:hypothetical protein
MIAELKNNETATTHDYFDTSEGYINLQRKYPDLCNTMTHQVQEILDNNQMGVHDV